MHPVDIRSVDRTVGVASRFHFRTFGFGFTFGGGDFVLTRGLFQLVPRVLVGGRSGVRGRGDVVRRGMGGRFVFRPGHVVQVDVDPDTATSGTAGVATGTAYILAGSGFLAGFSTRSQEGCFEKSGG